MTKYAVILKPLSSYVFGTERQFGEKRNNENYIVDSLKKPQQTTVLGCIRKEIIKQHNILTFRPDWNYSENEKKLIREKIGKESFDMSRKAPQSFGIIQKISPIFLYKTDKDIDEDFKMTQENQMSKKLYMKMPKDHNLIEQDKIENKYVPFEKSQKINSNLGEIRYFTNYDAKKGLSSDYISFDAKDIIKSYELFTVDKSIGINVNQEEDALFKMMKVRLNKHFSFIFTVQIEDKKNESFKLQDSVITMGAEKSSFQMLVKEFDKDLIDLINKEEFIKEKNKMIFVSDTFVKNINNYCECAATQVKDFRNSKTDLEGRNELRKKYNRNNIKFKAIDNGSVVYIKENKKQELIDKINEHQNAQKIGYNQYIKWEEK